MNDNGHYALQLALAAALCISSWRVTGISTYVVTACAAALLFGTGALITVVARPPSRHHTSCTEDHVVAAFPLIISVIILSVFMAIRATWIYKLRGPIRSAGEALLARARGLRAREAEYIQMSSPRSLVTDPEFDVDEPSSRGDSQAPSPAAWIRCAPWRSRA